MIKCVCEEDNTDVGAAQGGVSFSLIHRGDLFT